MADWFKNIKKTINEHKSEGEFCTLLANADKDYEAGFFDDAKEKYTKSYNIRTQIYEIDSKSLYCLYQLAKCLTKLKDYAAACYVYERCYKESIQIYGDDYDNTVEYLKNLILSCVEAKEYKKVITYNMKYRAFLMDRVTENSEEMYNCMNIMANAYCLLKDYKAADTYIHTAYKISNIIFPEDNLARIACSCSLANYYSNTGKLEEALKLYEDAFVVRNNRGGIEFPSAKLILEKKSSVEEKLKSKDSIDTEITEDLFFI